MTHEYTLLVGGTVLVGLEEAPASAIAWAGGTVLALGTDDEVRAISRGDSHVVELDGAFVLPVRPSSEPTWPPQASLEVGGPADLAVVGDDPRGAEPTRGPSLRVLAVIRGGRLVSGSLRT